MTQVIKRREWWKVKVMGNHGSLIEKVLRGQGDGKRPRGRPKKDKVMISDGCRIVLL